MRPTLASLLVASLAASAGLAQAPPNEIHFQARLSDAGGTALVGPVTVEVRLYDAAAGGVPLWSEVHNATALSGVVSLSLGSITALPPAVFDGGARFLAIRVGNDPEMVPRRPVLAVPYAARAGTVAALSPTTTLPNNLVTTAHVLDGSLVGNDFADFSIGPFKLAVGAVLSANIGDGQVLNQDLSNGAVSASKIAGGAVTAPAIAAGAINVAHLLDNVVNGAKVLDGSITGADVGDFTLGSADLGVASVTSTAIAVGAVDSSRILDGTILGLDMATATITSLQLASGSVGNSEIVDGAVTSSKLGTAAVGSTAIAAGAVGASEIAGLAVDTQHIAAQAVTNGKITDATITNAKIAGGAGIQGTKINPDFGSQDVTTTGQLGVGTSSPGARAHVVGSAFPNLLTERTTAFTSAAATTLQCLARTSQNMADGFGPLIQMSAVDVGGVVHDLGQISAERDTGDSSGRLVFRTFDAGVGNDVMGLSHDGRIGMGSAGANPQYRVSVSGGSAGGGILVNTSSFHGVTAFTTSSGDVGVYGQNLAGAGVGVGVAGLASSPAGFGVFSFGDFGASGTKSFLQPHPDDPSKEIRFICLEGMESGTYFRATETTAGGEAVVEAPEAFRLATEPGSVSAVATPVGGPALVWIESESHERVVVRADRETKVNVVVHGVRRGRAGEEKTAIRANRAYVPQVRGVPFGTQYPEAVRRILVENGTLNPDFTPNEATAARLGWPLRNPDPPAAPAAPARFETEGER